MKTAEVYLTDDFSNKSPLEQLAMASCTPEDAIKGAIPSRIVVEGVEEIHKLQAYLKLYSWEVTDLCSYSKLESRVYHRRLIEDSTWNPYWRYATLNVGNFLGVFGELKITTRAP